MVTRRSLLAAVGLLVASRRRGEGGALPSSARAAVLPGLAFEDQEGRTLRLDALRGRALVMVYGSRQAIEQSILWGRRIDEELRARRVYGEADPPGDRPVQILAVAQMGGIPEAFRGMVRAYVRQRTPEGFSLWLDWEDRVSGLFGGPGAVSGVVVADRAGAVRLVAAGPPEGATWASVLRALAALR